MSKRVIVTALFLLALCLPEAMAGSPEPAGEALREFREALREQTKAIQGLTEAVRRLEEDFRRRNDPAAGASSETTVGAKGPGSSGTPTGSVGSPPRTGSTATAMSGSGMRGSESTTTIPATAPSGNGTAGPESTTAIPATAMSASGTTGSATIAAIPATAPSDSGTTGSAPLTAIPPTATSGSGTTAVIGTPTGASPHAEANPAPRTGTSGTIALPIDPAAVPPDIKDLLAQAKWESEDDYPGLGSREAKKGGTLRTVEPSFPPTLRPFGKNANSTFNSTLKGLVYETLLDMDPITFRYVPALARRWAIAPDKKTFFFEIDERARWSDGVPVTAGDVVATWKMLTDPGIDDPFSNDYWSKYEEPKALSERVVMIRSKEMNWRAFLSAGSGFFVYPAHVLQKVTGKEFLDEFQNKMVPGSGPYAYDHARTNELIVLIRRPDWWQKDLVRQTGYYNFDRLEFNFYADENLAKEKFKKGEIDFFHVNVAREWHQEFIPAMMPGLAKGWIQRRKIYTHQAEGVSGLAFNLRSAPFDDKRVRLAFAHLYNREKMMDKLFFNEYDYLDTFYPNSPYEHPGNEKIRFNPDKAVELMEEAGWLQKNRDAEGWLTREGKRFEIDLNYTTPTFERILTIFQEDLKDVGIKLNLKQVTWATDIKEVGERSFKLSLRTYSGSLFPNPESSFHSKFADKKNNNNIWGFKNKRVDEICDAYPLMFDAAERIKAVREVDGIVTAERLYAFGWFAAHTRLLFWNKFGMPDYLLSKWGDQGSVVSIWWHDPDKERVLKEAMKAGQPLPVGEEIVKWWDEHHPSREMNLQ